MRDRIKLFLLLAILFSQIACSKEEKSEPDIQFRFEDYTLNTSDEIIIENAASTLNFEIVSNMEWSISGIESDMMEVTPMYGGAGSTKVTVQIPPNLSGKEVRTPVTVISANLKKSFFIVQNPAVLRIKPELLEVGADETVKTFEIESNTVWKIVSEGLPDWITDISPIEGEGNGTVEICFKENKTNKIATCFLTISYNTTSAKLIIKQAASANSAPTPPTNLVPAEGSANVSVLPTFKWSESSDPDGDVINYVVRYSRDKEQWTQLGPTAATTITFNGASGLLTPNTLYFFQVIADDGLKNGRTESEIVSFTTGDISAYEDGAYRVYQISEKPSPVKLVFTGDGFTAEHFNYGGHFDQALDKAIEAMFSVEPYKSYREYFTIYKLAAYSQEAGTTIVSGNIHKNTVFSTVIEGAGSTGIRCDEAKVFEHALKIPDIKEEDLYLGTTVAVIINEDIYAGTCYTEFKNGMGRSIAMIPYIQNSATSISSYRNVVIHELGGHGFGKLADEYVSYNTALPADQVQKLERYHSYGYYLNVSSTANVNAAPWSHFTGVSGYTDVGIFEGAFYYRYGAYRSEETSCMIDNRAYYNAQSRYMIVERLKGVAGEDFNLDIFLAKDMKEQNTNHVISTKTPPDFKPLGKPIMVILD